MSDDNPLVKEQIYLEHLKMLGDISFTIREIDIIACILNSRSEKKIAFLLAIAPKTVSAHVRNIMLKLSCNSKDQIIDFTQKSGKAKSLRQYYGHLLIITNFETALIRIGKLFNKDALNLELMAEKEVDIKGNSILQQIQKHLQLANICLSKNGANYSKEMVVHVEPCQSGINIILDADKKISKPIEFNTEANYYFLLLELLVNIISKTEVKNISEEFKNNYQILKSGNLEESLPVKPSAKNKKHFFTTRSRIIIICTIIVIITSILFYQQKNPLQTTDEQLAKPLATHLLVSYMPELLTGYEKFISREEELKEIKQALSKDNIVVITGQPGVGKSTCAIEYGKNAKLTKIVRYFNADSVTKVDQKYLELATELNLHIEGQSRDLVMRLVNNKLSSLNSEMLFIFDNVDVYDDVKEYLSNLPTNIKVVITTRKPQLMMEKVHITMEVFSYAAAKEYLENSLQHRHLSPEQIQELLENVGTLPYDLKCVVAYLLDNPSVDIKSINKEIGGKIKEKLFEEFALSKDPAKQQAWKILQYAAYLDPDFISIEIFKNLFSQDEQLLSGGINKLESLSLISIITDKNGQLGFRIHRKLQKAIQHSMQNHPKYAMSEQDIKSNLLNTLDDLFVEVDNNPDIKWQVAARLQPHVKKVLDASELKHFSKQAKISQANLYFKLTRYHFNVSIDYNQALKYAEISLNKRRIIYPANHHDIANSLNIIGKIYNKFGNTQKALEYLLEGLEMRKKLYVGDHADTANSLHNIGVTYKEQGEISKGLEYLKEALQMRQRLYFGNHPEIAVSLSHVGCTYTDLGDFKTSLKYLEASLKMNKELYSNNHHPDTAYSLHCIAWNYYRMGNYKKAIKYIEESIAMYQALYPEGHLYVADVLDTLGVLLVKTNDIKKALITLHKGLDMVKKFNIDNHFVIAFICYNLGQSYLKHGDYNKALEYGENSLNMRQKLYSTVENHHEIAESLHSVGDIYKALGNKSKALEFYKKASAMLTTLSLDHLPEFDELRKKIEDI